MRIDLAVLQPLVDEIEADLPGWHWSIGKTDQGVLVSLGIDRESPYAAFTPRDGFASYVGGRGIDFSSEVPALFRRVIASARGAVAKYEGEVKTASLFLLSHERRKRS